MTTRPFSADTPPEYLFSRRIPTSVGGRILQFPLGRLPVAVLFLFVPLMARNLIVIYGVERLSTPWFQVALSLLEPVFLLACVLAYGRYTRWVEAREAIEFSARGAWWEFGAGLGISAALVGLTFLVLLAAGSYRAAAFASPWILPYAFIFFGAGAFLQEFLFRILLYRLTEEWLGTWLAFALTAALFSLAHLANPDMTMAGFLGLLIGDVLLFGAFALTRRMWLVWGIHAGWNFFQDGVLGMPNSGITTLPSFIEAEISGPAWLTGGPPGIEASVVAGILQVVVGLWLLRRVVKAGQTVVPAWRRPASG